MSDTTKPPFRRLPTTGLAEGRDPYGLGTDIVDFDTGEVKKAFAEAEDDEGREPAGIVSSMVLGAKERWVFDSSAGPKELDPEDPAGRLKALGFDPITMMVRQYDEIQMMIEAVLLAKRPSTVALAQLSAQKVAITTTLLKYGYMPYSDVLKQRITAEQHEMRKQELAALNSETESTENSGGLGVTMVFTTTETWDAASRDYAAKPMH